MKRTALKWVCIIFCLLLSSNSIFLVNAEKLNNTQVNLILKKANNAYRNGQFAFAVDYYNTYLFNKTDSISSIRLKLADCYWQMRNYEKAFQIYKSIYPTVNTKANEQDKRRMAELYARYNQYQQAGKWLEMIPEFGNKAKAYSEETTLNKMKNDSLNWTVGFSVINTNYREFSPFLKNDTLFFSSNKPLKDNTIAFGWDGNNYSHIWVIQSFEAEDVKLDNTAYTTSIKNENLLNAKNIAGVYEGGSNPIVKKKFSTNPNINRELDGELSLYGYLLNGLDELYYNVSASTIDKNNRIYFSSNYRRADKNGINRICLMEGQLTSSGVRNIKKIPFGDANLYSVMHPAVNYDGTFLVCSSNKPNGEGGYDLYYTSRIDSVHRWDDLKAFGENINTKGDEVFPYISRDNTLYFSSDGMPGLGGLDIYKISLKNAIKGEGKVEHISYPINSSADDFGWTQDSIGTKGFFTSDRFSNNDNIYNFNYEPVVITRKFITGYVKEIDSFKPLSGSTVFLYNPKEDSVLIAKTDTLGKYTFEVSSTEKQIIKAIKQSYTNDCFITKGTTNEEQKDTTQLKSLNLTLNKFNVGFKWKLNNIRYDYDKSNIRADAAPILDSLVALLNQYPITIELGSHTDSRGSNSYNERLSQHRAESAVAYLLKKGIDSKRVTAKGYGESQLINKCADGVPCTDAEHQANRRTEVKVIGYIDSEKKSNGLNLEMFKDGEKINKNLLPSNFFDDCKTEEK